MTEKNKGGRPTKYKEEYCETIIQYFNVPHTKEVTKQKVKGSEIITWTEEVANKLPTFERFAVDNGVHTDTLHEWRNTYPKFSEACKRCKNMQKEMINYLAMAGYYNPTYTMFVAKNITDMRDTQHIEQESNVKNTVVITDKELENAKRALKEEV